MGCNELNGPSCRIKEPVEPSLSNGTCLHCHSVNAPLVCSSSVLLSSGIRPGANLNISIGVYAVYRRNKVRWIPSIRVGLANW